MNNNTNKVLQAIDQNPELLNELLNGEPGEMTRGGQAVNPLSHILGNVDSSELAQVSQEVAQNPLVKLFLASSGSLDAKDLVNYVGGVSGTRASSNPAVRALFDGRLDLKEILILIVLLKLFKRKNSNTYNNSAIGLLGSLLGYNTGYNSGLFNVLGGNNYSNGLFGNTYSNNLFGNHYSSGLFGNSYNTSSGLGNFLGLTGGYGNNSSLSNLMNFVNGNYNNNSQYQALYNILNQAAPTAVNNNGMVSASGLFSVLAHMMGY
ncbi:MAG: hypothetical protein IKS69_08010 [Erysipelotrichaceae bacterium]|nr:hypothetical protein [Erysipelotrichaceae bacterium]